MARTSFVGAGIIVIAGAILGLIYAWTLQAEVNLTTLINPRTLIVTIIILPSLLAVVCGILLILEKWIKINSIIILVSGVILLIFYSGYMLPIIGAALEIIGGATSLITAVRSY
jgi:uncharacterized membrane protein